jgi:hypothetical protein
MAGKNPDEEKAIKKAKQIEKAEKATEKRINKLNKDKNLSPEERLRRLMEEE